MPKRRPPVISSSLAATGTVASAFSYRITASNSPTSFSAAPLPSGLTVDSTSGLISGEPAAGTELASPYGVVISARNASGTGRGTLNLTVNPAPVPIPPPVQTATATVTWSQIATATGYKIFWGRKSQSYSYSQDVGDVLQCTVPDLTRGLAYYFTGQSYNTSQTSDYGNEVRFVP